MPPVRGGLDLGGTKIQAVVCDDQHRVIGQSRRQTPQEGGPPDVVKAMAEALEEAVDDAGVAMGRLEGVGLGSPGSIDAQAGTVGEASNLPDFIDPYPVAGALAERLGVRATLGNDVSVAVNAEFELGAALDADSLLGVFWGTGVGGGLVLDGKQWVGRGAAGEIGHMVIKRGGALCPCGRHGCMEAYAGRRAMEAEARRHHEDGEKTILFKLMEERGRDRLTAGIWDRALREGDHVAHKVIDRAYRALGAGVASAVNLLDVEAVVLGGGVGTKLGAAARDRLIEEMRPHLFNDDRPPEVLVAELGDYGGALGAALLVGRPPAQDAV